MHRWRSQRLNSASSPPQELRAHCEGPPEQPPARREPGVGPAQVQRLSEYHGLSVPVLQQLGVGGQLPGAVGLRVQLDRGALQAAGRRGRWCIMALVRRRSMTIWQRSRKFAMHKGIKRLSHPVNISYMKYQEFVPDSSCWKTHRVTQRGPKILPKTVFFFFYYRLHITIDVVVFVIFMFIFSGSKTLPCSPHVLSRRWGSLWSACCGSSTARFTEGEGVMEWSPSKRTHGLALASQGGVGNSSRPAGHTAVTTHSPQLSPDCQRNAHEPQGKECKCSSPSAADCRRLTSLSGRIRNFTCFSPRSRRWNFQRCANLVEFHTGMFYTQLKPPLQWKKKNPPGNHWSLD